MDVTEDVANPRSIEGHGVRGARFIQTKIETLPLKQRKHIMKEGIEIWKIDDGSYRNRQHVRLKVFMLLQNLEPRTRRGSSAGNALIRRTGCGVQRDDGK